MLDFLPKMPWIEGPLRAIIEPFADFVAEVPYLFRPKQISSCDRLLSSGHQVSEKVYRGYRGIFREVDSPMGNFRARVVDGELKPLSARLYHRSYFHGLPITIDTLRGPTALQRAKELGLLESKS